VQPKKTRLMEGYDCLMNGTIGFEAVSGRSGGVQEAG
jgi:hypothetical protein